MWSPPAFPYTFPIIWGPLGSPFQLQVVVAFDSDPFDSSPIWTDITRDVQSISTKRGRQTQLGRMEAGTASIRVKNHNGHYWSNNAAGPYFGKLLPGKAIQIRASYTSSTSTAGYYLYTGFVTGWPPQWLSDTGGLDPVVDVTCVDLIKNLSRVTITDNYAEEKSGTRVENVLSDAGWPHGATMRDIDAGTYDVQAAALVDEVAMSHLFAVQDAEDGGLLYIGTDGVVIFEAFQARLTETRSVTSQAIFGDSVGENYYSDLLPEYDDEFIYNDISITPEGETRQNVTDAASITAFGKRSLAKTSLVATNAEALTQATWKLSLYKDPFLRVRSLKIKAARDPHRLWPKVLGFEISTRITVRESEASIDGDFFIEGISHRIDLQKWSWDTSFQLSNASASAWLLGVASRGELGEVTWLL